MGAPLVVLVGGLRPFGWIADAPYENAGIVRQPRRRCQRFVRSRLRSRSGRYASSRSMTLAAAAAPSSSRTIAAVAAARSR